MKIINVKLSKLSPNVVLWGLSINPCKIYIYIVAVM